MKRLTLRIRKDIPYHRRRRAKNGVGTLLDLEQLPISVDQIVDALGGVRSAARACGIGTDTIYRLKEGSGSLKSLEKLAKSVGFSLSFSAESKSDRWKILHSSQYMAWQTPPEIWKRALELFGRNEFDLDPCSPGEGSAIPCRDRYTSADDGLKRSWGESGALAWVNPPYGTALTCWIDKIIAESKKGVQVIALVPARTGTKWWHRALESGARPEFIKGRIRFLDKNGVPNDPAPFDSAFLIWWA